MAAKASGGTAPAILDAGGEAPPVKKSGKRKKLLLALLLLVFLGAGGGAGAYWWFFMRQLPAPTEGQADADLAASQVKVAQENTRRVARVTSLPRSSGMVLPLPQFVLSISDAGIKRYLKIGLELEASRDISSELEAGAGKIHDAVLVLLAGKNFADLQSRAGRAQFKADVGELINRLLETPLVSRVFFTEFVVE